MGKYLSDPSRDKADEHEMNFAKDIENQKGWYPFIVVLKKLGFYVEKEGSFKKRGTDIVYDEYTYRLDLE